MNKIRSCDLEIKTQGLRIKTRNVQNKCENEYLLW
jgi:hypothetical protein